MRIIFVCTYFIILSFLSIESRAQLPITSQHNQTTARFISLQFKSNNEFDLTKIQTFIARLEKEKKALINDAYETKIIEKIELEVTNFESAVKSAQKELNAKKSKYIQSFDQFLIPKIQELYTCVEQKNISSVCSEIAEQFVTGYSSFYLPNAPRNIFHQDFDYLTVAKSLLGFSFEKSSQKVEAANLLVEAENLGATQACLSEAKIGTILTQAQIQKLKACQIDISIYNPSQQTLWRKLDAQQYAEAKNLHNDWFPNENDIITFKQIKFSSSGSPKLEAEFKRNGDDVDLKIKMGFETHTEIATSNLGKLLGFYQDTSVARKTIKIHFPDDMTFEAFKAQWSRKYHGLNQEFSTFVKSIGKDSTGNWVILKDVQLSINDPKFLRVGPYDPAGWDLPNLREQRAQILWFGFVNMYDTKPGNHMMLFEKTKNGLVPHYSFQDVGYSLHYKFQLEFSKIKQMIDSAFSWGVNTYSDTFLKWTDDKVHISWSDVVLNRKRFDTTTYSDIKWMARKIAKLPYNDIVDAVESANFPAEIADLYIHKITARRNEIVKAFGLENEFKIYSVPDLKTYSPNNKVKKGKVVVSQFEGYASYELPRTTILSLILQGLSGLDPLKALNNQFKLRVAQKVGVSLDANTGNDINIKNVNIMPGVNIEINRTVDFNKQYAVNDGSTQAFMVKDTLAIEVNIGSTLFSKIKDILPGTLSANANIKAWRREFEIIHFADTLIEGYKSEFTLFSFMSNWRDRIVDGLDRGEVFKISDSFGVQINGKINAGVVIGVPVGAGASLFWQKSMPSYFAKDQFNQLMIYQVQNTTQGYSFSFGFDAGLHLKIITLPILEFSHSTTYLKHQSALYRFRVSPNGADTDILTQAQNQNDQDLLNRFLDFGDADSLVLTKKEMDISATGKQTTAHLNFLLFWKKITSSGMAKTTIKTSNNETRNFLMYTGEKSSQVGLDKSIFIIEKEATLLSKDNLKITVEMDEADSSRIAVSSEIWNYDRKLGRSELVEYINEVNKLYSKDSTEPFFKDYALPPASEVNKYRKVYSHNRLFIYGDNFVNNLKKMSEKELEKIYTQNYKGNTKCIQNDITVFCKFKHNLKEFVRSKWFVAP